MKAREIRDLIDFISKSGLNEVNIETEEFKISVKKNPDVSLPEMILLTLNDAGGLGRLFYIDDNGDTNWIVITESSFRPVCDSVAFVPNFPETTEVIKLY